MNIEKIKKYILDFHERQFNIEKRNIFLEKTDKILTIIGPRRTGKTYLIYEYIEQIKSEGIPDDNIFYINFESTLFYNITVNEMSELFNVFKSFSNYSTKFPLYFFIDEPQVVENWEIVIRELYDNTNCKIFITGSSSKLLSKDIATCLRGRTISKTVFPLSFKEFLSFNKIFLSNNKISSSVEKKLILKFQEYLKLGGYPEVALEPHNNLRICRDYYDLVIFKDIIERYKIQNTKIIKFLMNSLINSISKEFSVNKLFNSLKSQGIKLGKNTLYDYLSILEDSLFVFLLKKFEYNKIDLELSIPKIYLNDISFLNLFSLEDYGKRLENIVFVELKRRIEESPFLSLNYFKDSNGREIDFIVKKGKNPVEAIQVCFDINNEDTRDREIKPLIYFLEKFNLKKGLIITAFTEETLKIEGKLIQLIPAWKWLL